MKIRPPHGVRRRPRAWRILAPGGMLVMVIAGYPFLPGRILPAAAGPRLSDEDHARAEKLRGAIEKIRPLHTKLGKPAPGDWLDRHDEPGQTFRQYLASSPVRPIGTRGKIYIQPLGEFTKTQRKILRLTADFMGLYFAVPVVTRKDLDLTVIPDEARRVHPSWGMKQILSTYVLNKVLLPRLPEDAAAYIALTSSDLWPGAGWNFVFGQASLRDRVGVWSIYRNGDPDKDAAGFRLCLLRTLKTATHETGHMFSLRHCTAYECNLCGSNNRQESDRRPIALCPECLAKVCWACRADPLDRLGKLSAFCGAQGLRAEAAFYDKTLLALGGRPPKTPATQPATEPSP